MGEDLFSIALTVPEFINIVTSLNLCILFIVLFFRKENTLPNKLLACILLLPALSFVNNYLILSKTIYLFPSIVFISQIGALIGAPLIYLYTKIFMGGKWNPCFILNILTIIAILACLHFFIVFLGYDTHTKNQFVDNLIHEIYPDYLTYIRGAFFILLNIYFIVIAVQVVLYSRKIMDTQAELEKLKLRYLQQFVILLWILNITILVLYLFVANYYVDFVGVPVVTTVFYIFLVRTAFNHTAIFTRKDFSSFKNSLSKIENLNVSRSGAMELSHEEIERIKGKIDYLMNHEKIYIDPDLSIIKLSEALELSIHQTSFFINKYLNSNFFNLINTYRIELAKDKMRQKADKSEIEVIGYEVGFNSKSAFYRAFNRYVQQSPSEFIRKL